MIVVTTGQTMVRGTKSEILAEFSCLVNSFIEQDVATKEEIQEAVDLGLMDDDARKEKVRDAMSSMIDGIMDAIFDRDPSSGKKGEK